MADSRRPLRRQPLTFTTSGESPHAFVAPNGCAVRRTAVRAFIFELDVRGGCGLDETFSSVFSASAACCQAPGRPIALFTPCSMVTAWFPRRPASAGPPLLSGQSRTQRWPKKPRPASLSKEWRPADKRQSPTSFPQRRSQLPLSRVALSNAGEPRAGDNDKGWRPIMSVTDHKSERNKTWQERHLGSEPRYGGKRSTDIAYQPGSWQERNLGASLASDPVRPPSRRALRREQTDDNSQRWENEGGAG